MNFGSFLPTGTFSASDHVVGNPAGATVGNGPLVATDKVVQVWSQGADTSSDLDEASEILGFFTTVGSNGTILQMANGSKTVIISGEDTSARTGYVWFVNDAGNDGVQLSDISLVATLDSVQLSNLVNGNVSFVV